MASFTERYHEFTKYNPRTIDRLGDVKWNEQPRQFKELLENNPISLTPHLRFLKPPSDQSQWDALADSSDGLESSYLARLLYFTCGVSSLYETPQQVYYFRCNPSAGGLYPIEVYLCTSKEHSLGEGIWYFHPLQMSLGKMECPDAYHRLVSQIAGADEALPQAFLIYTGKFSRGEWRYKQRTYRRMLLDLGHAIENSVLFAEFSRRHFRLFPSFDDQALLDLNFMDEDEVPLSVAGVYDTDEPITIFQTKNPSPQESFRRIAQLEEPMMYKQNQVEYLQRPFAEIKPVQASCKKSVAYHRFLENVPLAIRDRRSCREFSGSPIPLSWLERTLQVAFTHPESQMSKGHLKFALAAQNIEDLPQATYDLDSLGEICRDHSRSLNKGMMAEACLGQDIGIKSSALLVAYSDLNAATAQWGDRIYRYLCTDAGRIGQRLNLLCTHSPMGMSGVGGYFDDLINETLGLESKNAILYIIALGVSRENQGF